MSLYSGIKKVLPYEAKLSALGNGAFDGEKQRAVKGWGAVLIGARTHVRKR